MGNSVDWTEYDDGILGREVKLFTPKKECAVYEWIL